MRHSKITVVMMAGLPGAGKTTLAGALEHEFGWPIVDKDQFKYNLMQKGLEDDKASWSAYEHSFERIRVALVEHRTSIIFDTAALHLFILDRVLEIVSFVKEAELKTILCVVDRDVRNQRLRSRKDQFTKITGDPSTIADYLNYFDHLPEDKLIVYTNVPIEECISEIKKYVLS